MFLAETTSKWGFTGAPDERWDGDRIAGELDTLRGSDFEVVAMNPVKGWAGREAGDLRPRPHPPRERGRDYLICSTRPRPMALRETFGLPR
jgi:hypothetical protein